MRMPYIYIVAGCALAVILIIVLICWRRAVAKKKLDQEQMDRKIKEEALDRALSNRRHLGKSPQAQAPMEVHYKSEPRKGMGTMLRLTEQAESMTKEYLFQQNETILLGEEYGRAAVFQRKGKNRVFCELFPYEDGIYVRRSGKAEGRLIRGKKAAPLTGEGIRLRSGDRIETQAGVFLVEFI